MVIMVKFFKVHFCHRQHNEAHNKTFMGEEYDLP